MNNVPEVSIVIPVYNEASHIIDSIQAIDNQIKKVTSQYEIVLIDDGSTDETWDKLAEHVSLLPYLRIIRLSRNFGKEFALSAGLEQSKGAAVIIMDADLQHPPTMIPMMVNTWRQKAVSIVECVKRERGKESVRNRVGANLFYGFLHSLTGYNLQGASDFKLLDRKVIKAWAEMGERNLFFRGMTAWLGFKKVRLEFDVSPRVNGETKWSFLRLTKLALNAVVSFTSLPLRFVSLAGLLFFFAAVILGVQTLVNKLNGSAVDGFTTVILLLLIIGSVIMISLGIIGEYISAIYHEVKGRPRYIIEETITSQEARGSGEHEQEDRATIYG